MRIITNQIIYRNYNNYKDIKINIRFAISVIKTIFL